GIVPGLPDWRFAFHGRGLVLEGPGNECLDVDFYGGDEGGETIDPYFFTHRAFDLKPRPVAEARLAAWLGDPNLTVGALDELKRRALIVGHLKSEHVFHLGAPLEALAVDVASVIVAPEVVASIEGPLQPGKGRHREWLFAIVTAPATR